MPLQRHPDSGALILPEDPSIVRFAMMAGDHPVRVELPVEVLREEFGFTTLGLLEHFASHRTVIEATASQVYDALKEPADQMRLTAESFETKASRSHAVGNAIT